MNAPLASQKRRMLGAWMTALGLLAIYAGASGRQGWAYRTWEAKLCDISLLGSGIVLLAAGLAAFLRYRRAMSIGAAASAVFAFTLFVGVASGVIPCSGPT